jgi:transposase
MEAVTLPAPCAKLCSQARLSHKSDARDGPLFPGMIFVAIGIQKASDRLISEVELATPVDHRPMRQPQAKAALDVSCVAAPAARRGCRVKGSVRAGQWNAGVPRNFIESRREQGFLLPPDVREWLPADRLAWFVIDAVAEMELSAFYAAYRVDGHGRAAYEPSLMVALVLFAFATNVRSSRAIERHCRQDVAYRVITGNLVPDHATIARFICRHERALAGLFGDVLKLCDRAGLVKPGVVSIDGTRIAGNASPDVNHSFDQIAREILAEARATDEAEDELYGEERGDELPEELRTAEGRREFFRRARQELKDETDDSELAEPECEEPEEVPLELRAQNIVGHGRQGRDAWLREGKRQLEQHRWENPDPIARSRRERLLLSAERLQDDLDVERRANDAYEHYRATARDRLGRRPGGRAEPYRPPDVPAGKVNTTDPDSRPIPIGFGFVQGYNAQAAVNEQQIVLAAEITNISTDFSQLDPMVTATLNELERAGIDQPPEAVAADAGYWNEQHMDEVVANKHIPVLVAPDKGTRATPKRWLSSGRASWMRSVLGSEHGHDRYRKRKQTVEPLFGNTKHNSGVYRFHRRGRTKVRLEWRLLMMTHNMVKVHRHQLASVEA